MNTFLLLSLVFFLVSGIVSHAAAAAIVQTPGWRNDDAPVCAFGCLTIVYSLLAYIAALASLVTLLVRVN